MGLCNYYRRFIEDFSTIAVPLTELTSKEVIFDWSSNAQSAFERLKEALCSTPILAFPRDEGEYVLDMDASAYGIGAVLQQVQDGEERVVAYASKKLNKQQRRYCTTRRELLAIVVFLREFRRYLLGRPFTIRTDHNSLVWLLNFKEPQGQLARWLEYVFEYKFKIIHRAGKKHGNADALSRGSDEFPECDEFRTNIPLKALPCGGCRYCQKCHEEWTDFMVSVDDVVPLGGACRQVKPHGQTSREGQLAATAKGPSVDTNPKAPPVGLEANPGVRQKSSTWAFGLSTEALTKAQIIDPVLEKVHEWVSAGSRPTREEAASLSPAQRCLWLNWESLRLVEGVMYYFWEGIKLRETTPLKLLVPAALKGEILHHCHNTLFAAHLGVRKTYERVRQRFYWYGMRSDIRQHIATCEACGKSKRAYRTYRAALADFRVGAPLDRVALDLMGPLPVTEKGNRHLLVICDYFTRWVEAFPLPDQKAETVAHTLVHEFVCRFGAPLELHSDQGRNFESVLFKEVCRLLGITKTRTTSYHPSSNGLVEKFNGTLATMIRTCLADGAGDWDLHIPILTAAYRSTVHTSTGFSPNFLMLGRETTTPVDIVFPRVNSDQELPEYVEALQKKFAQCYGVARCHLKSAAEQQRKFHDTRVSQNLFKAGEAVFKKAVPTNKFSLPWQGPYIIKRVISDAVYEIADKKKTTVVHHDRLKIFQGELPRWAIKLQSNITH